MKFLFAPTGNYRIQQIVEINGEKYRVESVPLSGRSMVVVTHGAKKFQRTHVVLTDEPPIEEKLK